MLEGAVVYMIEGDKSGQQGEHNNLRWETPNEVVRG